MIKSESAQSKIFRLSRRLEVELTVGAGGMSAEWLPMLPDRLTEKEIRRYRAARQEILGDLAQRLGGSIVVVET